MTAHPAVPRQACRAANGIRRGLSGAGALRGGCWLKMPNHLSWRRPLVYLSAHEVHERRVLRRQVEECFANFGCEVIDTPRYRGKSN